MRSPIAPAIANAYKVLDGEDLTEQEALQLTEVAGCDILDLVSLANKVRDRFAPGITPCSIINAKSGACSQNCRFCAQAACHRTGVDVHPLLDADEIVRAARAFSQEVSEGKRAPEELTEEIFSQYLYSSGVPDPELIIRPSGEKRISNFLLWQSAYSEYVFMNVLWPDFSPKDLDKAIEEYHRRNRRFGGT